jgi:prevent-host-death family protein
MTKSISTSELKAHCAQVVDDVAKHRSTILVTKHGKPVAKIVPVVAKPKSLFGFAQGMVTIHGDIIAPLDVEWEAAR